MPMAIAKHMFNNYGLKIIGTIVSTDKKSRANNNIPLLKLSNGSRNGFRQRWHHEGEIKFKTPTGKAYYISAQLDTTRSRFFLSSNEVGYTEGLTVKRHIEKEKKQ